MVSLDVSQRHCESKLQIQITPETALLLLSYCHLSVTCVIPALGSVCCSLSLHPIILCLTGTEDGMLALHVKAKPSPGADTGYN